MPKYLIERDMPGVGASTKEDLKKAATTSCDVLKVMGPEIQWLHSYISNDKIYCIYISPNEEMIKEHAQKGGFPVDKIVEVKSIIDPTTAE